MSRKATDWAWRFQAPSPSAKLVLLALADRADDANECYPSVRRLECDTGLNRKTIIKATRELELAGAVIDTKKRKGATQRVKVYRLTTEIETVPKAESFQKRNSSKSGTLNGTQSGTLNSPKSGTQNLSVEPAIEPLIDHSASDRANKHSDKEIIEALFAQFWKHYKTKTGKQSALKAWHKFMRGKAEGQIRFWLNLMLAYYHQQQKAGVLGYEGIHAATFINQRRWEDSPEFMQQFKEEYLSQNNSGGANGITG